MILPECEQNVILVRWMLEESHLAGKFLKGFVLLDNEVKLFI